MTKTLQPTDRQRVQTLAEFRYALRKFLQFSEGRAVDAGLHPQQHQLLLHIAGAPEGIETTVSYAAERLGLRHNSAVELSKRCEGRGSDPSQSRHLRWPPCPCCCLPQRGSRYFEHCQRTTSVSCPNCSPHSFEPWRRSEAPTHAVQILSSTQPGQKGIKDEVGTICPTRFHG